MDFMALHPNFEALVLTQYPRCSGELGLITKLFTTEFRFKWFKISFSKNFKAPMSTFHIYFVISAQLEATQLSIDYV